MMTKSIFYLLFLPVLSFYGLILSANTTPKATKKDKTLVYKNKIYEENIKTVLLFNRSGTDGGVYAQSTTSLQNQGLFLEFDDLSENDYRYFAKIIHCNKDWTKSYLNNLEFIDQYNEFEISNYEYSFDTKVEYTHFSFDIPQVKLPGNYLLKIYKEGNENDLIITRRFMVFDNKVNIGITNRISGGVTTGKSDQQLDFVVNYTNFEIINPLRNLHVTLRQNQRWDNAIQGVKPTFVKEGQRRLEYKFFDDKSRFKGGNEYRFFDLRSVRFPGQNIWTVNTGSKPITAMIMKDKPRGYQAYSQYDDINGNFLVANQDTGNGSIEADYIQVEFTLESKKNQNQTYLFGGLTDWNISPEARMEFDEVSQTYKCRLLLKQGWYNYQYYVQGTNSTPNQLEGNYFQTENEYEILIYYRPITINADLLIGYASIRKNQRIN